MSHLKSNSKYEIPRDTICYDNDSLKFFLRKPARIEYF